MNEIYQIMNYCSYSVCTFFSFFFPMKPPGFRLLNSENLANVPLSLYSFSVRLKSAICESGYEKQNMVTSKIGCSCVFLEKITFSSHSGQTAP